MAGSSDAQAVDTPAAEHNMTNNEQEEEEVVAAVQNAIADEIREELQIPETTDVTDLVHLLAAVQPLPQVYTPANHMNFLHWAKTATANELRLVLRLIHSVEHRCNFGPPPPSPAVHRPDIEMTIVVPSKRCTEADCERCRTGRGGWQFRWAGPWLCPATIPANNNTPMGELFAAIQNCSCTVCQSRRA